MAPLVANCSAVPQYILRSSYDARRVGPEANPASLLSFVAEIYLNLSPEDIIREPHSKW